MRPNRIPTTAVIFVVKLIGAACSVLSTVVIARTLGDDVLGRYGVSLTYLALASSVTALGGGVLLMKTEGRSDRDHPRFVAARVGSVVVSLGMFLVVLPPFLLLVRRQIVEFTMFFTVYMALLALLQFLTPIMTRRGEFLGNSLIQDLLRPMIPLAAGVLGALASTEYERNLIGFNLVGSATAFPLLVYVCVAILKPVRRAVNAGTWDRGRYREAVRCSLRIGPSVALVAVLTTLVSQADRIYLTRLVSDSKIGIYFAGQTVALTGSYFVASMIVRITPDIARYYLERRFDDIGRLTRKYSLLCVWFSFGMAIASALCGRLLMWIYGISNPAFIPVVVILMVGQGLSALFGFGATVMMYGNSRWRVALTASIATAVLLGVVIGWVLVPVVGIVGAAIGSCVSMIATRAIPSLLLRAQGIKVGVL